MQQFKNLIISLDHSASAVPPLLFVHLFREQFPRFAQRTDRGRNDFFFGKRVSPYLYTFLLVLASGYAQQDAEECYSTLLYTLSQSLAPLASDGSAGKVAATERDNAVKQLFRGEVELRYKCLEAEEEEEPPKHESFLKLLCNIR